MDAKRICPVCGVEYNADPVRLRHGRQKTCSRECSYRLVAAKLTRSVTMTCPVCGKEFKRCPSHLRRARHASVCSRECHYKARTLGIVGRVVDSPYNYTPESKAAMIAASSRPKGQRVFHPTICSNCGIEFDDVSDGRPRKSGKTFCSLDCCNAYRVGENNPSWRGGHPRYYGPSWRRARRDARKRDDYTCRRCGKVMKPPGRAPDVHHIKPVSSFENADEANALDNLVTLCHPCHQFAEWNGIDL